MEGLQNDRIIFDNIMLNYVFRQLLPVEYVGQGFSLAAA